MTSASVTFAPRQRIGISSFGKNMTSFGKKMVVRSYWLTHARLQLEESRKNQGKPGEKDDDQEPEAEKDDIRQHGAQHAIHADLGDPAGDEKTHTDGRQEEANADCGSDDNGIVDQIDAELLYDGQEGRQKDDYRSGPLNHGTEDDEQERGEKKEDDRPGRQ